MLIAKLVLYINDLFTAQCKQGKLNVVIAMDASQSLTFLNFLMVKEYTQLIARNILSSDSAVPDTSTYYWWSPLFLNFLYIG